MLFAVATFEGLSPGRVKNFIYSLIFQRNQIDYVFLRTQNQMHHTDNYSFFSIDYLKSMYKIPS